MIIHDRIALGAFAGILGSIPQLIIDFLLVQLNYSQVYAFQIVASIYLKPHLTLKPMGLILGGIVWEFGSAMLGVLIVYLFVLTGNDYWWLKGLGISNGFMFTIFYGFIYTLGGAKIIPFDITTNFTQLIGHTVFGISTSYLIIKWDKAS